MNKSTASILALFLGFLGFHLFYLGKPYKGIFMLIFGLIISCTIILPLLINISECVRLAQMPEDLFKRMYIK